MPSDEQPEDDSSDTEAESIADKPSPKVSHYVWKCRLSVRWREGGGQQMQLLEAEKPSLDI